MTAIEIELLTVQQLAELFQVPIATIYRWRSQGVGPRGMRIGRHVRYHRSDVEAFLAEARKASRTRACPLGIQECAHAEEQSDPVVEPDRQEE